MRRLAMTALAAAMASCFPPAHAESDAEMADGMLDYVCETSRAEGWYSDYQRKGMRKRSLKRTLRAVEKSRRHSRYTDYQDEYARMVAELLHAEEGVPDGFEESCRVRLRPHVDRYLKGKAVTDLYAKCNIRTLLVDYFRQELRWVVATSGFRVILPVQQVTVTRTFHAYEPKRSTVPEEYLLRLKTAQADVGVYGTFVGNPVPAYDPGWRAFAFFVTVDAKHCSLYSIDYEVI